MREAAVEAVLRKGGARAAHHWAMDAVLHDDASKANCRALRSRGHKHGRALRTVVDRMLGVVCSMIETGQAFDPERRSKNRAQVL